VRKLHNPFSGEPGYFCFGCCPDNPHGLHLEFWQDEQDVVAFWKPHASFQGWGDIVHGGVLTALVDEVSSWAVLITCKRPGVTSRLEMKFLKPISTLESRVTVRSRVQETKRNLAVVEAEIYDSAGEKCTQGRVVFFTFAPEKAPANLRMPDPETFFRQ